MRLEVVGAEAEGQANSCCLSRTAIFPDCITCSSYRSSVTFTASRQVFIQSHVTAHAELCWLLNCEYFKPTFSCTCTEMLKQSFLAHALKTANTASHRYAYFVYVVHVGVTPMGWMEKMIQYKEKAKKQVCVLAAHLYASRAHICIFTQT